MSIELNFSTTLEMDEFGGYREIQPIVPFTPEGDIREKLARLEEAMRQHEPIDIPTRHLFAKGIYAREIVIPKGTILTGNIHKTAHISVISKGDISVLTEDGVKRIKAPCTIVSPAGIKRAGYAHEETVWTTFHASDETDLERLEDQLIAQDYKELEVLQ